MPLQILLVMPATNASSDIINNASYKCLFRVFFLRVVKTNDLPQNSNDTEEVK